MTPLKSSDLSPQEQEWHRRIMLVLIDTDCARCANPGVVAKKIIRVLRGAS